MAGGVALTQRGEHRDDPVGRGADVDDGRAGAHRFLPGASHKGKSAGHLRQFVEHRLGFRWTRQEAFDGKPDQAWIAF